jgi:hypothetical protein
LIPAKNDTGSILETMNIKMPITKAQEEIRKRILEWVIGYSGVWYLSLGVCCHITLRLRLFMGKVCILGLQ